MLCFFVPRAQDFYIFLTLHEFYIPQISNFTLPPYTEIRKKTRQIKVRKILMTIFNVFSLLGGLALFLFGQGFGPGAHTMTFASLSYPTSLRGVGVGLNQTLMRSSSTLSLFLFPLLVASLDTAVFWVIALAPFIGLASLLAIRWEPSGYDVDAEDYR